MKTGFLALGGGIGMIPYLEEIARRELDVEGEEFLQIMAVAQSFPGPMGINLAVMLGYRMEGFPGAVITLAAITFPSLVCASILFAFLRLASDTSWVKPVFTVLKASMVGIILGMGLRLAFKVSRGLLWAGLAVGSCLVFIVFKIHPVWLLLGAGVFGLIFFTQVESQT